MFNKKSIGKRVVSPICGIGTVSVVNTGSLYPVTVKWDSDDTFINNRGLCQYTAQGKYISGRHTPDRDITLVLVTKQGTPEARRIVAMLARLYRTNKHALVGYPDPNDESYYSGLSEAYQEAYQQAKQLLGESK